MSVPQPTAPRERRPGSLRGRNVIVASGFAVLGLAVLWASMRLPDGIGSLPGPGFFPSLLAVMILGFAVIHALDRAPAAPSAATEDDPAQAEKPIPAATHSWRLPALAALALLGYIITWEWVSFLVRTPLLTLVLMRASGSSWRSAVVAALLVPLLLFAMFQLGLRVDLG